MCLIGPGRLRVFFYNLQGFFSIMVLDLFRLTMVFSHMTYEDRKQENGGSDVFLWFLLHFPVC